MDESSASLSNRKHQKAHKPNEQIQSPPLRRSHRCSRSEAATAGPPSRSHTSRRLISLLEVGAFPQLPSANATALLVPDTSSLACPQKLHTSASAISLLTPDQPHQKQVEGGLTPLTPDLLTLQQNVSFIRTNDKYKTLQQLVTTKTDKLRDKPHPAPERVRPYGQPSLLEAITLNPGQHIIVDGQRWVLRERSTISHQPQEPTNNQLTYPETNTRRTRGT